MTSEEMISENNHAAKDTVDSSSGSTVSIPSKRKSVAS